MKVVFGLSFEFANAAIECMSLGAQSFCLSFRKFCQAGLEVPVTFIFLPAKDFGKQMGLNEGSSTSISFLISAGINRL